MAIYEHQGGKWQAYRVARSVDGKLHQEYFPRTAEGYAEAKRCDAVLAKQQAKAQKYFSGYASRWNPKRARRARKRDPE